MSLPNSPQTATFTSTDLERLRDRMATGFREERCVSLEQLLREIPESARDEAFLELLMDELALRAAEGEASDQHEYVARFPERTGLISLAFRDREAEASLEESPDPGTERGRRLAAISASPADRPPTHKPPHLQHGSPRESLSERRRLLAEADWVGEPHLRESSVGPVRDPAHGVPPPCPTSPEPIEDGRTD